MFEMKEYQENRSYGWNHCLQNYSIPIVFTNPNQSSTFSDFVDLDADNKWNELT